MCLILIAWKTHPDYPLILLANRDEKKSRPTQALHTWESQPTIYAGRDNESGGSWLGVTPQGRFAAVTNLRDTQTAPAEPRSRGFLVTDFLQNRQQPSDYLRGIEAEQANYRGFNLLVGNPKALVYLNNRGDATRLLTRGVYGMSNAPISAIWPKVQESKVGFIRLISKREPDTEELFKMMQTDTQYPDNLLPDTGVGQDVERQLSPIFIPGQDYGTRSTTLLMWDNHGNVRMQERSYDDTNAEDQKLEFKIAN